MTVGRTSCPHRCLFAAFIVFMLQCHCLTFVIKGKGMHTHTRRFAAIIFIIITLGAALIAGHTTSAQCVPGPTGGPGDDTITCTGNTGLDIDGDLDLQLGAAFGMGSDTIIIYGSHDSVSGEWVESIDGTALAAGGDTITNYGLVLEILGDAALSDTGNAIARGSDVIVNYGGALLILGSGADSITGDATADGNNTIINYGYASEIVGNEAISDDGTAIASGDDTIIVYGAVISVTGDWAHPLSGPGNVAIASGDDTIIVFGPSIEIIGDVADGDTATASGDDLLVNYGETGYMFGDAAFSDTGTTTASGDDTIINYGIVHDNIIADFAHSFGLPPGTDPTGNGTTTGNDVVVNHGVVEGDVLMGGGNDRVIIVNGAPVLGIMNGGAGTDRLTFELASANYMDQYTTLAAWANALVAQNPAGGTIIINGVTFTWLNFEDLMTHFRLLAACNLWPAQVFYPNADTIDVWGPLTANQGFHVATIDRRTLTHNPAGQRFEHPETARGWYVMVYWVNDHYQINVYDQNDTLLTDRCLFPDLSS